MNQILRDEDQRKAVLLFHFLKLLDSALKKLFLVRGCVWRAVPHDVSQQYEKNEIVTGWSVTSCSPSVDVVENFFKVTVDKEYEGVHT